MKLCEKHLRHFVKKTCTNALCIIDAYVREPNKQRDSSSKKILIVQNDFK